MLPNGFILSNGLNFALVVLKLLMFKTCGIIVISKIEFSVFPVLNG